MTKGLFMQIMLIVISVLVIVGIVLMAVVLLTDESRNEIKVLLKDGKTEIVEFEDLALVPAGSCEYIIKLKGDNAKKYDLTLDFIKTTETEEKTLIDFAYVRIIAGDKIVYDDSISEAIKKDDLVLPVDFDQDLNTELSVEYYMPINVGNEAANVEAAFALQITASNE